MTTSITNEVSLILIKFKLSPGWIQIPFCLSLVLVITIPWVLHLNAFKKDLQRGYSIGGGDRYLPLDIEDIERVKRVFELDNKYSQILDDYGTYIVSSDTYYQK